MGPGLVVITWLGPTAINAEVQLMWPILGQKGPANQNLSQKGPATQKFDQPIRNWDKKTLSPIWPKMTSLYIGANQIGSGGPK